VDVARNREVHQDQRPAAAIAEDLGKAVALDYVMR
jgi:hypothetical protein